MIVILTGPPGAGKSTVGRLLAKQVERAVVVPVDDIREWVVQGISHPVDWTDETERQFQLAEAAACAAAAIYSDAGFLVVMDHCRGLERWDEMVAAHLPGRVVHRFGLFPNLESNLHRNATRSNKAFDTSALDGLIRYLHTVKPAPREGWHLLDTTHQNAEETAELIWSMINP